MNTDAFDRMTADLADMQLRQAALVTAIAKHYILPGDPDWLAQFLSARRIGTAVQLHVKAAVAAIGVSSGLAPTRPMMEAILTAVDRRSVLGQLGAVKVPSTNIGGAVQTTPDAFAYWRASDSRTWASGRMTTCLPLSETRRAGIALIDPWKKTFSSSVSMKSSA